MTPDKALSLANDIACTIATLRAIEDELRSAYTDGDYHDYAELETVTSEPIKPPTLEEVRAVLAAKSGEGLSAEVRTLLEKYGAKKLSAIDPANYAALLTEAEGLNNG